MIPNDIKTRRQLTMYLYQQLSLSDWGREFLANLSAAEHWTDEPVSQDEVATAISQSRRYAKSGATKTGEASTTPFANNKRSSAGSQEWDLAEDCEDEDGEMRHAVVSAAVRFDQLIAEYVATHPNYRYPKGGHRHPAILAHGQGIKSWLIERMGGFKNYLTEIIDAAKIWFPPGCCSREFRIFCILFEGSAAVGWGNYPEMRPYDDRYCTWMFSVQNSLRSLVQSLRQTQADNFQQDFAHLAILCSRKFTSAGRLVVCDPSVISTLEKLAVEARVEVSWLREAASVLWERCVKMYDHPQQGDLFNGWPDSPDKLWSVYFYRELAPRLVQDDDVVRDLLGAIGTLPNPERRCWSLELQRRLREIELPRFT